MRLSCKSPAAKWNLKVACQERVLVIQVEMRGGILPNFSAYQERTRVEMCIGGGGEVAYLGEGGW